MLIVHMFLYVLGAQNLDHLLEAVTIYPTPLFYFYFFLMLVPSVMPSLLFVVMTSTMLVISCFVDLHTFECEEIVKFFKRTDLISQAATKSNTSLLNAKKNYMYESAVKNTRYLIKWLLFPSAGCPFFLFCLFYNNNNYPEKKNTNERMERRKRKQ